MNGIHEVTGSTPVWSTIPPHHPALERLTTTACSRTVHGSAGRGPGAARGAVAGSTLKPRADVPKNRVRQERPMQASSPTRNRRAAAGNSLTAGRRSCAMMPKRTGSTRTAPSWCLPVAAPFRGWLDRQKKPFSLACKGVPVVLRFRAVEVGFHVGGLYRVSCSHALGTSVRPPRRVRPSRRSPCCQLSYTRLSWKPESVSRPAMATGSLSGGPNACF